MTDQALRELQGFDLDTARVHLWVFKSSTTVSRFTANYVRIDEALEGRLREFAKTQRAKMTEWIPYGHLAQPTDNGCLSVSAADTDFALLQALVDRPELEHPAKKRDQLKNAAGYVVKFYQEERVLYAVRRSPATWKTAYRKKGVINMAFQNGALSAVQEVDFTLEPGFDLFALDDSLLVGNKRAFESMMKYRAGFVDAFVELQEEKKFISLFTDMAPLVAHVGINGTHLRRMAVIQERRLYENPKYLGTLREVCERHNWGIQFDAEGLIIPTEETARVIMTLLLDQRLISEITAIMYDVPGGHRVDAAQ
ncbi:Kiwa anti-phage protein KwaB-like domain-containing protein [Xanthomonas citri pv. mangiferaeindicae]|uniref:Kiwa anti-phage protein KwaB-like domain-containing protein n=1 Tax=Xanthomonas citri TaxID=346 RepID=UPI000CDE35E6|nr:Kiwa anti-phage protein KwaB-like domain-containing protein [Xanthomonas citri]